MKPSQFRRFFANAALAAAVATAGALFPETARAQDNDYGNQTTQTEDDGMDWDWLGLLGLAGLLGLRKRDRTHSNVDTTSRRM